MNMSKKSKKVRFTREEDDQCKQVIELFSDFLKEKQNFSIARAEGYGYIVLFDITEDYFEASRICSDAETFFEELLRVWEVDYLFRIGTKYGCPDFETSEEAMNTEERSYWERTRSCYRKTLEKIRHKGA